MSGMSSIPGAWCAPWVARIHWPSLSVSHQLAGVGLDSQPHRRAPFAGAAAARAAGAAGADLAGSTLPAEVAADPGRVCCWLVPGSGEQAEAASRTAASALGGPPLILAEHAG